MTAARPSSAQGQPPRAPCSRRAALQTMAAAAALLTQPVLHAQAAYPSRPVRIVVTLPAGTSADAMARFAAERLGRALGQPVIVDNRPGASSMIGAQAVASAPADGYTLLYGVAPAISLNPHLFKKLPYKAADFAPVIHLLDVPFVLVVRSESPWRTVRELLDAARAQPAKLSYCSYGEGSPNHIAVLQLLQQSQAQMTHVPYKDGGLTDVLGGRVDAALEVTAMAMPHIQAGRLRPLAVSARERVARLPDVPTLTELGLGAALYSWNGLFAPAATPAPVLARLSTAMQAIAASDEYRRKVLDFTQVPRGGTVQDFTAFLAEDDAAWGRVIASSGLRLD